MGTQVPRWCGCTEITLPRKSSSLWRLICVAFRLTQNVRTRHHLPRVAWGTYSSKIYESPKVYPQSVNENGSEVNYFSTLSSGSKCIDSRISGRRAVKTTHKLTLWIVLERKAPAFCTLVDPRFHYILPHPLQSGGIRWIIINFSPLLAA